MAFLFRYFWFIGAAFMLAGILFSRRRAETVINSGVLSQDELDQLFRWASIWFVGLPLVLGLISLAANWPSPFCSAMISFVDLPHTLFSAAVLFAWASLLWWVWRSNAAEIVARVLPSLDRDRPEQRYSPKVVRLVLSAVVTVSAIVTPITWRTMPVPPEAACPAASIS